MEEITSSAGEVLMWASAGSGDGTSGLLLYNFSPPLFYEIIFGFVFHKI